MSEVGAGFGMLGSIFQIHTASSSFILKTAPAANAHLKTFKPFEREAAAYDWFQSLAGSRPDMVPDCHVSEWFEDGSGNILLEDLTRRGAAMADPLRGLQQPQVAAGLRAIARIHSLSMAQNTRGGTAAPPSGMFLTENSPSLIGIIEGALADFLDAADHLPPGGRRDQLHGLVRDFSVAKCLERAHRESKLVAVCHGDLWSNNVMFAQGDSPDETEAFIIDWQFATWGNPLIDVSFFILSSLPHEARQSGEESLLRAYYDALDFSLRQETGYRFDDCIQDYRIARAYGAIMTIANIDSYQAYPDKTHFRELEQRLLTLSEAIGDD
jgi:hypothetical protein